MMNDNDSFNKGAKCKIIFSLIIKYQMGVITKINFSQYEKFENLTFGVAGHIFFNHVHCTNKDGGILIAIAGSSLASKN